MMKKQFEVGTGKPKKSGTYVALMKYDWVATLIYSEKYGRWNARDDGGPEEVEQFALDDDSVQFWIYEEDFKNAIQK